MTIECPLRVAAREWGAQPALVDDAGVLGFGALEALVAGTAARLRGLGVEPGARVAFALPNGRALVVLLLAAIRAGAVACPLSTRLPAAALADQARRLGAALLVAGEGALPGIRVVAPEAVVASGPDDGGVVDLDRPATIVFTSGSTGRPKAALHRYGNHYFSALGSNANIALGPGDGWLLSLPLYHVGGLGIVFRCLIAGAAVVLPAPGEALAETLARRPVTHVSLVATQLARLLDAPEAPVGRLKAVLLGGSALPPALVEAALARGLPVYTSYGLTEMASQVTTTAPGDGAAALRASGRVLPYRQLRLTPDGEICVRGETRFAGYVEGEALERPFDDEGWFHTGDLGRLGADGLLYVEGRRDNLFISGGENVQPEEVEAALGRLGGVAEAVVVPVPDAVFGQRPVAFVRPAGAAWEPGAWAAALGEVLPRFKIPVAFYPWPAGAAEGMKVDRRFLQAHAEALWKGSARS